MTLAGVCYKRQAVGRSGGYMAYLPYLPYPGVYRSVLGI